MVRVPNSKDACLSRRFSKFLSTDLVNLAKHLYSLAEYSNIRRVSTIRKVHLIMIWNDLHWGQRQSVFILITQIAIGLIKYLGRTKTLRQKQRSSIVWPMKIRQNSFSVWTVINHLPKICVLLLWTVRLSLTRRRNLRRYSPQWVSANYSPFKISRTVLNGCADRIMSVLTVRS